MIVVYLIFFFLFLINCQTNASNCDQYSLQSDEEILNILDMEIDEINLSEISSKSNKKLLGIFY